MSISFKMVPKKNNLVSPPQIKYYPCAIHEGEDDLESLADIVSSQSTISKADCYGVIMALTKVIGESLADGRIVRIDSLGSFQITVRGLPGESPDELGKATIKGANIIYKPSKNMKKMLNGLTYKRIR
ncbi:HU family DNA-binding protein [Flavobacterium caseinilyticum]|uniref:DNA-binding protein n=1 Tax=Flavobacterium caseinilyticum TaxID=2541732 RepID=A0A4R5AVT6_9FLAO|nr:HU family DNA-binding protein [Flavobacterium caseinilyticum]TDD74722.1 DNA-binding protein [Flavobacterium caseinilyticum]